MSRVVLTVDGLDGSGKSTFAGRLVAELEAAGAQPILVRVDDFRQVLDWASGDEATLYYERYYALGQLGSVVQAFAAGATELALPGFDGLAGRPLPERTIAAGPNAVLVIEGVFIRRIEFGAAPVFHLYLASAEPAARARLVARDTARGRTRAEVEHRLDHRYVPCQRRYHEACRPRDLAHVILDNTDPTAPRLLEDRATAAPLFIRTAMDRVLT